MSDNWTTVTTKAKYVPPQQRSAVASPSPTSSLLSPAPRRVIVEAPINASSKPTPVTSTPVESAGASSYCPPGQRKAAAPTFEMMFPEKMKVADVANGWGDFKAAVTKQIPVLVDDTIDKNILVSITNKLTGRTFTVRNMDVNPCADEDMGPFPKMPVASTRLWFRDNGRDSDSDYHSTIDEHEEEAETMYDSYSEQEGDDEEEYNVVDYD